MVSDTDKETKTASAGEDEASDGPAQDLQAQQTDPAEPQTADTAPESEITPSPPAAARAGPGMVLALIALVLAAAACAGVGYLWYRFDVQQRHEQEMATANLVGELKAVAESTRSLEKRQDEITADQDRLRALIEERLDESIAQIEQQQQELTNSVSKIYESLDRSIDSWALEEVEQLLRIANRAVALAGDTALATTALEFADQRLEQLGNPEFLEIRRQIADEITQLKSIEQVDISGLAFQLSSLAATVDELPLMSQPDRAVAAQPGATPPVKDENMWLDAGQALLADLKSLVRIQNVTEPAKPLLTPNQRYYLVANLRLMLFGAQLAALRTDTKTFRSNLAQASQWLSEYFDTESNAVQSMTAELERMVKMELTPKRPTIAGSLAELERVKSRMTTQ